MRAIILPYLLCAVVLCGLFVFLQPHVRSMVSADARSDAWQAFVRTVVQNGEVDAQDFWKTREFGSLGGLVFDADGFDELTRTELLTELAVPLQTATMEDVFLYKRREDTLSVDGLTSANAVREVMGTPPDGEVVYKDLTTLFYVTDTTEVYVFLLPIEQMRRANGLFNYQASEEFFEDRNWVSITRRMR